MSSGTFPDTVKGNFWDCNKITSFEGAIDVGCQDPRPTVQVHAGDAIWRDLE